MVGVEVLTKRIQLAGLYPPFGLLYLELLRRCQERRGIDYYATSALRAYEEQQHLFEIGRVHLGDGTWAEDDDPATAVVTKAPPGFSAHNFGIAVDSCRDADVDRAGLQPGWDLPSYLPLALEARELGLDAAYWWVRFKEGPHVQLDLGAKGLKIVDLKHAFEAAAPNTGLLAVWALLDAHGPWVAPEGAL